jgi:hypothetical protein
MLTLYITEWYESYYEGLLLYFRAEPIIYVSTVILFNFVSHRPVV